jgi:hypothetical protein
MVYIEKKATKVRAHKRYDPRKGRWVSVRGYTRDQEHVRLSQKDVARIHRSRGPRARKLDEGKNARLAKTEGEWKNDPGGSDHRSGIDSKKGRRIKNRSY